ncbi:MAG: 3-methyladenine DNA glycosylase [Coraliomargaritaceae bacterium]
MKRLDWPTWTERAAEHKARAERWTLPYRQRSAQGRMHAVHDFHFIYYRNPPSQLEAWHPGPGYILETNGTEERFSTKHYSEVDDGIFLDLTKIDATTRHRMEMALTLCLAVEKRPARFGCFGMHEWAMVYRGDEEGEVRHCEKLPLRLPQEQVDAFVRSRPISCSHFDAFRFFTPSAKGFNRIQPSKKTRLENEQCGCLHTNMDLYKLAAQCMPWVGSKILWQCFELAAAARVLDMEASPYDCRSLGLGSVPVETEDGRRLYEERQRALTDRAQLIRSDLIHSLRLVLNPVDAKTIEI